MAAEDFKRKLTAIFSADVVDYSRLMGEDEDATIRTSKRPRRCSKNYQIRKNVR